MTFRLALALCAAIVAVPSLGAQYTTPVGPTAGSRVRVDYAGSPDASVGRLLAFGGDSLVLLSSAGRARTRLGLRDVTRVEVSDGFDRWAAAKRASIIGALAGAAWGAATLGRDEPTGGLVSAAAGAIVIAPLAAGAGAILAPERWRTAWQSERAPGPASSGYQLAIDPGTDVRLRVRDERVSGRASGIAGDTISLSRDGRIQRYDLRDLASVEIRGGQDKRKGVTIGAGIAVLITAVAGGIDVSHGDISAGEVLQALPVNAALGGLIGYAFAPGGWERLPLPHR